MVTWRASLCDYQSMRQPETTSKALKEAEVTFIIEMRPATPAQLEAGRRLFSRLLRKAQASCGNESNHVG